MQETDLWAFIKGQTEAVNFLKKAAINPVHAYLFVGPEAEIPQTIFLILLFIL